MKGLFENYPALLAGLGLGLFALPFVLPPNIVNPYPTDLLATALNANIIYAALILIVGVVLSRALIVGIGVGGALFAGILAFLMVGQYSGNQIALSVCKALIGAGEAGSWNACGASAFVNPIQLVGFAVLLVAAYLVRNDLRSVLE